MRDNSISNINRQNNKVLIVFFSLVSFFLTIFFIGFENLSPFKTDWFFSSLDAMNQYIGWCFFKNDDWRFPLGLNPNYGTINNSIIYSDSIPILAIVFKTFKSFIELEFNYFSLWVFVCFFFQGFFSYKIIFNYTKNGYFSLISSLFFLTAPIFLHKMTHVFSLGSHFLILASIYVLSISNKKKYYFYVAISFFTILVHFYLFFINSIIFFIDLINNNLFKEKKIKKFFKYSFVYLIISISVMYISGYFAINSINSLALGYGEYKFNLLGFFDPVQLAENSNKSLSGFSSWSLFLKDIPSLPNEYEGFAYLGLGVICLLLFSIINFIKLNKTSSFLLFKNIFFLVFILFFILSLSNNIDFGITPIIHIELNKYILAVFGIIRSTGRLIWPAYYLILIFALIYTFKKNKIRRSIIIVFIALIIQLIDISPGLKQINNGKYFANNKNLLFNSEAGLVDSFWQSLEWGSKVNTTYEIGYNSLLIKTGRYFCKNNIKSNIFALARYDRFLIPKNRYEIYDNIYLKKLDSSPYIVSDNYNHILDISDRFKDSNLGFFYRDNLWIIQKNKKNLMNKSDIENKNLLGFPIVTKTKTVTAKDTNFFGIGWLREPSNPNLIISDGNISSILFKIKNIKLNNLMFELDDKKLNQELIEFDIYINDKFLKTQKIYKGKTNNFEIYLEDFNDKSTRIDFKFIEIKSQWDTKKNINFNKFGIFLKSIKFDKI